MDTLFLGLLAETSIHPGMGSVGGAIDLPVAREAATDYPVIVGSSLKGAIKEKAERDKPDGLDLKRVFGDEDAAGNILVSDARLLLLPVRSLSGSYKWATCPHLLERLVRDLRRAGQAVKTSIMEHHPSPGRYFGVGSGTHLLYLEERTFKRENALPTGLPEVLEKLVRHAATRKRLAQQLVVLNDDDFTWFARYGLAVQARNQLGENKQSNNLWYEETLPPDSLFYAMIAGRTPSMLEQITDLVEAKPYLQAGGNETVGQGWFAIQTVSQKGGKDA